ncbi:MAG: 30S ribosomal protein S9 [Patescibacteria group bacterium]
MTTKKTQTIKTKEIEHEESEASLAVAKKKEAKEAKETKEIKPAAKPDKYYQSVGRRKTAIARVRLYTKGTGYLVNSKELNDYFPLPNLQRIVELPLKKMKSSDRFRVEAIVSGGGSHAQAEAIGHAVARALVIFNVDFRKRLKRASLLTRDPRMKERRKYGLKKARKAPRWSKR